MEHFSFYEEMSLDELLSFDTNDKTIDKCTIQIEKDNGLEQVEYMISEFRKVAVWEKVYTLIKMLQDFVDILWQFFYIIYKVL